MKFKELRRKFLRLIAYFFLNRLVNILCRSLKTELKNKEIIESLKKENKNFIIAFWHGTMLLPWYLHRNEQVAALVSKSKDGDLLAKLLGKWNYRVIRGSSSEGGDAALKIMIDYARKRNSIAITPDGPRGPEKKLKAGVVVTAKKSGLPIILAGVGYKNKKQLRNWDKFQIPSFFSRANVIYSEPVYVDENLNYESVSDMMKFCEDKLNSLQAEAEIFQRLN